MASSKLSDADKQIILDLYRQPEETTSTLAERYGVSNSTISRVLKQNLPADEYSQLIQQKRSGATAAVTVPKVPASEPAVAVKDLPKPKTIISPATETPPVAEDKSLPKPKTVIKTVIPAPEETEPPTDISVGTSSPAAPIRRRRSSANVAAPEGDQAPQNVPTLPTRSQPEQPIVSASALDEDEEDESEKVPLTAWDEEGSDDLNSVDGIDTDEDYGDEDDLENDEEEEEEDWDNTVTTQSSPRQERLEILPFDQASFQRTCYLVVDRLAELITCPLRDFSDLGQIPKEEEQARTLPIFENHRIARRFSRRNQRVIKIPDGSIIPKTQPYLQAKGITRLLINGQVYALH